MVWRRLLVSTWSGVLLFVAAGCASSGGGALPISRDTPFALGSEESAARVTRAQRPDPGRPPAASRTEPTRPKASGLSLPTPGNLPTPPGASPSAPGEGRGKVSVRAWVNGRPIFDEEVMASLGRYRSQFEGKSGEEAKALLAKIYNDELNQLVERELILQDAYKKLEKNPKVLEKLKAAATREFDKKLARIIKNIQQQIGTNNIEQVRHLVGKDTVEMLRRQEERTFIATEYIRSRIHPRLQQVGHREVYAYYLEHQNEFRTVDRVRWQDIFIAVGGTHATTADARRSAEEIVDRTRRGEPFEKFLPLDEGTSWKSPRKGEGEGQRRGEIKPAVLEPHLFQMQDGQIGPVVDVGTGFHVFKLLSREHAGQLPFSDKVQLAIATKLKNETAEREYKRIVKELRERAVIEVEQPGAP
ncbi:MAG: peptidyl-prolyl cis-trans isomerase [Gemmataceae bacterium]|nr:peptidyl-prolyl cis-trans isomerase [Gemmataceae bacterium]